MIRGVVFREAWLEGSPCSKLDLPALLGVDLLIVSRLERVGPFGTTMSESSAWFPGPLVLLSARRCLMLFSWRIAPVLARPAEPDPDNWGSS